jgi:glycosyltransferase involved in cell wall biosynthesis
MQSYKNTEIIVINDASTQQEYYTENLGDDIKLINLEVNMRVKFNSKSAHGLTRNEGLKIASGKWVAFLDDDDYWIPEKLQIQMYYLKKNNSDFCSTNYYKGYGMFNIQNMDQYSRGLPVDKNALNYNSEYSYILKEKNFIYSLLSTIIIKKELLDKVGWFNHIDSEDWELWNRTFNETKFLYLDIMLTYYDLGHAGGRNYVQGFNRFVK